MKRILNYITIIMFFTIIGMFAISTLFYQHQESINASDNEDYVDAVDQYLLSNFPLQSTWKNLRTSLLSFAGKLEIDGMYVFEEGIITSADTISQNTSDEFVKQLNEFSANSSANVYTMLVPTACGIYSSELPDFVNKYDQKRFIDDVYLNLDNSIATLDAYNPLYSSREEYIYNRTDNRWTSLGAFYTYSSVIKKLGFNANVMSTYDIEHASRAVYGELYNDLGLKSILADKIDLFIPKWGTVVTSVDCYYHDDTIEHSSVYNRSTLSGDNPYACYMYGDNYEKAEINTLVTNAPSLLVIKSPYTNALIPFLVSHYSDITVVDLENLGDKGLSDVCNISDYDQVLVMYDLQSLSQETSISKINK